jgi:16S rRNA (guanine527-N7)-methyltransferase
LRKLKFAATQGFFFMTKDEKYQHYLDLLLKWSKGMNLTSITDPDEIRSKHFEDSTATIPFLGDAKTLIDIGTGAGFPGIPIKIECPNIRVVLLDSTRKKINFCRQVIFKLNLVGIEALQGRAEDPDIFRTHGPFDIVISRATWPLEVFLELADPYYNHKGKCIAMKGARWQQELKKAQPVIEKYGLTLTETHPYTIGQGEKRCLLIFKK